MSWTVTSLDGDNPQFRLTKSFATEKEARDYADELWRKRPDQLVQVEPDPAGDHDARRH